MEFDARSKGFTRITDEQRFVVSGAHLVGEDLTGRRLMQFSSAASRFESCRFDKARIESASFGAGRSTSEYLDCSFDGARLSMGPGGYARFVRCSFLDVDIRDWFCFAVELVDCTFGGRLRKAVFNGTVPPEDVADVGRARNEFEGNDFSGADLVDVSFRTGIDLTQQRLPDGPPYIYVPDAPSAVRRARAEVITWSDLELRRQAMPVLGVLERSVEQGQAQLLLRSDNFPRKVRAAVAALFAELSPGPA